MRRCSWIALPVAAMRCHQFTSIRRAGVPSRVGTDDAHRSDSRIQDAVSGCGTHFQSVHADPRRVRM
jgi:hypothetical protein